MKISAKLWTAFGAIVAFGTLIFTLIESGNSKPAVNSQTLVGSNNIQIQGQGNKIDTINLIDSTPVKVKKLYYNIIADYLGSSKKKVIQDFGQPFSELDASIPVIGLSFQSSDYIDYQYTFDNGTVDFYFNKKTEDARVIQVSVGDNNIEGVAIPALCDRGPSFPNIVLGKSYFSDIFRIGNPQKVFSNWGSAPGAVYLGEEFYFGRIGNYYTYVFGIQGDNIDNLESNFSLVRDKKPNSVIIK